MTKADERRLVLRTVDGQHGINGIVKPPFPAVMKTTVGSFKLARWTRTYVLYQEQGEDNAASVA